MKFYRCPICGNIIKVIEGNINLIRCCNREMEELKEGTIDASLEKHVPVYEKKGDNIIVKVGEVRHPMEKEHYIMFIALLVDDNINLIKLKPNEEPEVTFKYVKNAKIYAYCNLHGLWVSEVE